MSEHTPGPWTVDDITCQLESDDVVIGVIYGADDSDVGWANGCLARAAPDLLAACKAFLEAWEPPVLNGRNLEKAAVITRAAIAKATGHPPGDPP